FATTFLFGGSSAYLEEQYEAYLVDPSSVDPVWKQHFDALPKVNGSNAGDVSHAAIKDYFVNLTTQPQVHAVSSSGSEELVRKQSHVMQFINAYRSRGHRLANLDPLEFRLFPILPELQLSHYGLSD
ncbi:MAG: 2-oxoglutarate dehydrogenase E1 subunit family protein, partial [Gammaproteobacteria bacterium]